MRVRPDELPMRADGCAQGFVMQDKRDLDGAKSKDQTAHEHALERQVIEHIGNMHEVGEQQRHPHDQRAHQHDDAGPLQDITEAAHGEAAELAFFETHALHPRQANSDQINLNINAEEIFEDERNGIHCGGNLQQPRGRDRAAPLWQPPKHDRLEERRQRAEEQDQVNEITPETISFP